MVFRVWIGLWMAAALMVVSGAAAQAQTAPVVAVIDTAAFYDPENAQKRVTELSDASAQVAREFQSIEATLRMLEERLTTITREIGTGEAAGMDPATMKQKEETYARLEQEYNRKRSEAEVNYARRLQDVVGPIEQRVREALQTYLKGKGYTDLVDLSAGAPAPPGAVDETAGFSAWYNSRVE